MSTPRGSTRDTPDAQVSSEKKVDRGSGRLIPRKGALLVSLDFFYIGYECATRYICYTYLDNVRMLFIDCGFGLHFYKVDRMHNVNNLTGKIPAFN